MSTEAGKFAPTRRRGDRGASGPGLALAQSGEDDDTDYDATGTRLAARRDYRPATRDYWRSTPPAGTPPGSIWRPGAGPGQPSGDEPGRPGRGASLSFPDRPHVASPPERGPVRPDKETA